jgi:hypothetical protein
VLEQQVQQELVVVVAVVSSSLISTTTLNITHQIKECLMSGKGFGDKLEQIMHKSLMILGTTWRTHGNNTVIPRVTYVSGHAN